MKTALITVVSLISTLCICEAGVSMLWEQDLSSYMNEGDDSQLFQLANNSVCIAINDHSNPVKILVYDSAGNKKLDTTLAANVDDAEFLLLTSNPDHFAIKAESFDGYE
jgi:hypothetical protein